jgi:hypothetical protein
MEHADLMDADLSKATLSGAILLNALLPDANLSGAIGITNEELARQAASLEGTTMPDGQEVRALAQEQGQRGRWGEHGSAGPLTAEGPREEEVPRPSDGVLTYACAARADRPLLGLGTRTVSANKTAWLRCAPA